MVRSVLEGRQRGREQPTNTASSTFRDASETLFERIAKRSPNSTLAREEMPKTDSFLRNEMRTKYNKLSASDTADNMRVVYELYSNAVLLDVCTACSKRNKHSRARLTGGSRTFHQLDIDGSLHRCYEGIAIARPLL